MEKLRELLNSYEEYKEKETWYSNYDWRLNEINDEEEHEQWITAYRVDDSQLWVEESIAVIICKWYCFIDWLVESDKIDFEKSIWEFANKYKLIVPDDFYLKELSKEDELLMLLSIQENPIEFLISILK